MNRDYTHITVLLDRSGSMQSVLTDTIGGFNRFLRDHQKAKGQCTISLHQFDDQFETPYAFRLVKDAPKLNNDTFQPRGSTALLAAISKAIDDTGERLRSLHENARPGKVIFVIITDGLENASERVPWAHQWTRPEVNAKIEHQKLSYSWEFVYIGANQDAIGEARSIGVAACQAMDYTANPYGTRMMYSSLADNTVKFREGAVSSTAWTTEDRKAQEEAKLSTN